jgi:hypothetical protein
MQGYMGYNGDKQWELLYARMWLSGRHLYTDLFPVNPPLIFWLYSIPVRLSDAFAGAVADYEILVALGLVVVTLCIWLGMRLLALSPPFAESRDRRIGFAALLFFVLVFRTGSMFFLDREHLFLVLTLPYLIRCMPSLLDKTIPRRLRVMTGLLAGLGFCIKPQCLLVLAGIVLISAVLQRSWRVFFWLENLLIAGTLLAYLGLITGLYPDYFTTVMPMAMLTYQVYRRADGASIPATEAP